MFYWLVCKILTFFLQVVRYVSERVFPLIHANDVKVPLPPFADDVLSNSATQIADGIRTQKISSEEVVKAFIKRIQEVNPIINCVVEDRFDLALQEAKEVDKLIRLGEKNASDMELETPFLGVPFTIKDVFSVKGMHWTAGLVARREQIGIDDADVVIAMKKAGAILLAITNVPELAMWWETHNHIYGISKNPYNVNRTVGGSSGGEGGILSAGGSPCGIGSDVGGSVRIPAFFCGIFAHKPTPEIVSNFGHHFMLDPKYLTVGPMSRFCSDLTPLYRVLAGGNKSKLKLDAKVDLSKLRFFFVEDFGSTPLFSTVQRDLKNAIVSVIRHITQTFQVSFKRVDLYEFSRASEIWHCKMRASEKGPTFVELMGNLHGEPWLMLELLKSCFGRSDHTVAAICNGMANKYLVPPPDHPDAIEILNLSDQLQRQIQDLLGDDGVLLVPPSTAPAPYHHQPLTKSLDFAYTGIFNILGLPVTQVPLGLGPLGLPLGVQVVANAYQDHLTLAVAAELERAFGGWVCP